jgi:hypothetical protein
MSYRDRRLRRAARLRDWAERRQNKAAAAFATAKQTADGIPFGQPILVGHHSERHARRDQDRIHRNMTAGLEHERKAADMSRRADEIERQADAAIYDDDPDAIDRLKARIAELEAERARCKAINAMLRKHGPAALTAGTHLDPPLTAAERDEILMIARVQPWTDAIRKGFPPYHLQNLGGTINRQKKRLAALEAQPAPTPSDEN